MKKNILVLMLAVSLLTVLVGCSKVNENKEGNQQKEPQDKVNDTQEVKQQTEQTTEVENQKGKLNPYDYERINQEGAISMSFIFADPLGEDKEGYLTFVGQLDNHSYNLDEYDLSEYITLVDDKGNSPQGKPKWELYSGGGHHIINYLLFPDDGFITPETKYIKLVIKDFIDVPVREFIWEKEFLGKTK